MGPKSSSGRAHTVRVVIADDNVLMPVAVGALLEPDADIEVAGVSYEADRILPLVAELQPDLLLLNSEMPGTDGLAFLDRPAWLIDLQFVQCGIERQGGLHSSSAKISCSRAT